MGNKRANLEVDRETTAVRFLVESLPQEDLLRLSQKIAQRLKQPGTALPTQVVPLEIFSGVLSPAEALVKYLKENKELKFHEIGGTLCRDERGIWGSYHRAKKKKAEPFDIKESKVQIPLQIFSDRKKSILEAVIVYLVDEDKLKFSAIAKLLNKKYSTVYTTYVRAKEKASKQGGAV